MEYLLCVLLKNIFERTQNNDSAVRSQLDSASYKQTVSHWYIQLSDRVMRFGIEPRHAEDIV